MRTLTGDQQGGPGSVHHVRPQDVEAPAHPRVGSRLRAAPCSDVQSAASDRCESDGGQRAQDVENGAAVSYCGIVTPRQQPDTAKGVIFASLEDETGVVQVIACKHIREQQREELLNSRLLVVHGIWQREGAVCSLVAQRLEDLTPLLGRLSTVSRDFR